MNKFVKASTNKLKNSHGGGEVIIMLLFVIMAAIYTICGTESDKADKAEKEDRSENNSQECYNAATSAISYSGKDVDLK